MYPNDDDELTQFMMLYAQVSQITCADEIRRLNSKRQGTRLEKPTVPRERKTVTQVYRELGKHYFRRSFCMSYLTFGRLYRLLESGLKKESATRRFESDYVERSPNGPVLPAAAGAAAAAATSACSGRRQLETLPPLPQQRQRQHQPQQEIPPPPQLPQQEMAAPTAATARDAAVAAKAAAFLPSHQPPHPASMAALRPAAAAPSPTAAT